ncbi:lysozyme inhibitor LprI family protein [Nitratireductor sp. GZWM139]|uniref:lysozyme inhibitor LprI family protein n=1 Tax=Nitratireductor sp. GZWM139 TaxID=2950541 RepID=UPI0024BD8905|nr:lysozyme inhibitor LprI family protein [Nitratireductor sp. GZWM139]MDJ1464299.1 lysozyme inhibitor LprI family protein [Nitratireductor sp. GZWM139]
MSYRNFRYPFAAFAFLLFASSAPLHADELDCDDAQTQADMTQCAGKSYQAADKKLNARYGDAMKRYESNEEARTLLRDAQRAWIAFRDAECDLATLGVRGGSIEPMIRAQCLEDLTEDRSDQLEDLVDCQEGDLNCL